MKLLIRNGRLLTPQGEVERGWLIIEDGVIRDLGPGTGPSEPFDTVVDAEGGYVSPGFIDLHVHGGGGHDFMDGTVEAMAGAARLHLRHGTTAMVPTTLTCSDDELYQVIDCYRQTKACLSDGPVLLGLHLEGPYFAPAQAGAQDPAWLRSPSPDHYQPILDAGGDDIVRLSAAVELDGALALGDELKRRGILGSIGHTDATYLDVVAALEHGFTHVTHLYSTMSSIRRVNAYRVLGVIESVYLLDDLTVEIIADGSHLPPELLRLIARHIAPERICLVTDAMRGAGLPDGTTVQLGSLQKGQPAVIKDGVAFLPDFTAFAGSVCTADRCVRTMHQQAGLPVADAVRLMTENPARVIGVADRKGRLAPGFDADLCLFDSDINVRHVFVGGQQRF